MPSLISKLYFVMSSTGGACWSADFASIVCRWVRKMNRKRFCSVGGSDIIFSSLPDFFVYIWYLASLIVVPRCWPYRAQENACSVSELCMGGIKLAQDWLKVWEVASSQCFQGLHFPLPYRYKVVSEPVIYCMPRICRNVGPSWAQVALMSQFSNHHHHKHFNVA